MSEIYKPVLSCNIGFTGILTLIFITLKLTGFINWSWWWVISPLWLPIAVLLILFFIIFIIAGIFS